MRSDEIVHRGSPTLGDRRNSKERRASLVSGGFLDRKFAHVVLASYVNALVSTTFSSRITPRLSQCLLALPRRSSNSHSPYDRDLRVDHADDQRSATK